MQDTQHQLRETAKRLLTDGDVDLVIGWEEGTLRGRVRPAFIADADEADQLIWSPLCNINLAKYVRGLTAKTAVVVKGCDMRAVQVLVREHQIERGDLHCIGVACPGLADVARLDELTDDQLQAPPAPEVLDPHCLVCEANIPDGADVVLGEAPKREPAAQDPTLGTLLALSADERLAYFVSAWERCLRCSACIKACPLCYCTTCFAEQIAPRWVHRRVRIQENQMFQLGRAMHLAGRCVGCGDCQRACPVSLPLRALNAKIAADVRELFGKWEPTGEELPPFLRYDQADTEVAIEGAV